MAENYKILYEQMKKMLDMYQDEIVPNLRKELDKRVKLVYCRDCAWYREDDPEYRGTCVNPHCGKSYYGCHVAEEHYCSFGERRSNEKG